MHFDVFERIEMVARGGATCLEAAELAAYLLNTGAARHGFMGDLVRHCIDEAWIGLDADGVDWIVNPDIDWAQINEMIRRGGADGCLLS